MRACFAMRRVPPAWAPRQIARRAARAVGDQSCTLVSALETVPMDSTKRSAVAVRHALPIVRRARALRRQTARPAQAPSRTSKAPQRASQTVPQDFTPTPPPCARAATPVARPALVRARPSARAVRRLHPNSTRARALPRAQQRFTPTTAPLALHAMQVAPRATDQALVHASRVRRRPHTLLVVRAHAAPATRRRRQTASRSTSARRARTTASMPTIAQTLPGPSLARVHRDTWAMVSPAEISMSVLQAPTSAVNTPTARTCSVHSVAPATTARARRQATGVMASTVATWMSAR